ncbi:cytochrome d ubiquinol oxidase subunit II [Dictyobacter kobayashii]|uniref:Cytochrome D ubiquinol oxidase subunit II n=1 Tax=Dictyobacter kobayashii TaxID=2014872 RepID=A0A402ATT9_9CHLR|nr:cytochrome d ubiquinol oxidase subunit II [Dictyobacter kobayashii]GCE22531.1 cytochrome D ubiquinol oxidase subunit II [Dictyobacter kobayashii]
MILAYACAVLLWLSMITYATLGGADFGGGFWDLFSHGSDQDDKRQLIVHAVGPVWEANNVWLIYLVVGLFTAFPAVAALLATALFIPFTLILIGVVLRGASFAFRTQFFGAATVREIWGRAFGIASIITPFLLGACAAAVASGQIRLQHGQPPVALWSVWLSPFALTTGAIAVALCATIAPIYLTVEAERADRKDLAETFRKRAFIGGTLLAVLGLLGLFLAPSQAPLLWHGMLDHALWAVGVTMLLGIATIAALFFRRYKLARLLVGVVTGAFLGTWGLSQLPYIIPPI